MANLQLWCLKDEEMWESSKNYVFLNIFKNATKHLKNIFLEYFQEYNQTLESIFYRTKHKQCKSTYVQCISCFVYIQVEQSIEEEKENNELTKFHTIG